VLTTILQIAVVIAVGAYLVGYVFAAALYLSWVGSVGPVGVLAAACRALFWPVDLIERLANPDRPPLP
jgi:hypothetical protein